MSFSDHTKETTMNLKTRTEEIYAELKLVDRMRPGRTPWQTLRRRAEEFAAAELLTEADRLERDADLLHASLLAPSMAERAMREDAAALRAGAFDRMRADRDARQAAEYERRMQAALAGELGSVAQAVALRAQVAR